MRVGVPLMLILCSCAAPERSGRPGITDPPRNPTLRELPPGTVIRIEPLSVSGERPPSDTVFVDALLREALRQSERLDFAGGVESTDATPHVLSVHFDSDADRLATTLRSAGGAPLPLASTAMANAAAAIPDAIDRLAIATRQALGDPATDAMPAAALYSADPICVRKTEAAADLASRGKAHAARALLEEARPRDPGSTPTLAALAALTNDVDKPEVAARIAYEALLLEQRLSPTTRHRLARTLLLARARAGRPEAADRDLLELALATRRERPHDPHATYSQALALNFLSRFDESAPLLRELRARWPNNAAVGYHLTFAELANGQPHAARAAIDSIRSRLPRFSVVLPRSLALYHSGAHDELRRYLDELANDPTVRKSTLLHEVRRMQAAHALLTDRREDAVRYLLDDLEWIRQRPSKLEAMALDVAETGEVLVRIGQQDSLRVPLGAFDRLGSKPAVFDNVLVFLSGMLQVVGKRERARAAEASLLRDGHQAWSSTLRATAHRQRGELQDELREWVHAYQSTESPLARASLARVLRAAGSNDNADEVLAELRERSLSFRLRPPHRHALLSPGAALAYLATL